MNFLFTVISTLIFYVWLFGVLYLLYQIYRAGKEKSNSLTAAIATCAEAAKYNAETSATLVRVIEEIRGPLQPKNPIQELREPPHATH